MLRGKMHSLAARTQHRLKHFSADLSDSPVIGIVIVTTSGLVVEANAAFLKFLGFSIAQDAIGRNVRDSLLAYEADWRHWDRVSKGQDCKDIELSFTALSKLPGGTEHILLCSSDQDFRHTVEQILATLGYTVCTDIHDSRWNHAGSGAMPAVIVVDSNAHHTLLQYARKRVADRDRDVRVVVVGESDLQLPTEPVRIPKPFTLLELSQSVRQAIDGTQP